MRERTRRDSYVRSIPTNLGQDIPHRTTFAPIQLIDPCLKSFTQIVALSEEFQSFVQHLMLPGIPPGGGECFDDRLLLWGEAN